MWRVLCGVHDARAHEHIFVYAMRACAKGVRENRITGHATDLSRAPHIAPDVQPEENKRRCGSACRGGGGACGEGGRLLAEGNDVV